MEGGYRISGRKIFGSGSPAGTLLVTSAVYDDPADGLTVLHFPVPLAAEGVTVLDNWRTLGMRATGSHDVLLDNRFPIWHLGGHMGRVGADETAFHGRSAGHTFNISGVTEAAEGFDAEREWARDFWSALQPYHTSVYVNFLMDEGDERIRQAYGAKTYDQLKALKRRYDPDTSSDSIRTSPPLRTWTQAPEPDSVDRARNA